MATDAYNTAMDMMNNNGKDLFDWFNPDMGDYPDFEFPIWDGNHHGNHHDDHSAHHHDWDGNHHDWFVPGTDHTADMGWPDLNNFDGTEFGWDDHKAPILDPSWGSRPHHRRSCWDDPACDPMPTEYPPHWDYPLWDPDHGSRGMDDELPADLADHDSWLSSLLGDTTDEAMDNTWFPNPWDVMTHTTSHFDFDMGSKMEDSNKPPKGPKGKPGKGGKKPKGPQKGLDARL